MRTLLFDTESTDLKAMMGRILCASFAYLTVDSKGNMKVGKPWTVRYDDETAWWYAPEDITLDGHLCYDIKETLEEADCIVGWNSKLHDIPLLNARLAKAGFPPFNPHLHIDLMWYAGGSSMKIGSRKLDNVAKFFELPVQKTPISWDDWQRAGAGNREAMDVVVKHCEHDVKVLGEAYKHLLTHVKNVHR